MPKFEDTCALNRSTMGSAFKKMRVKFYKDCQLRGIIGDSFCAILIFPCLILNTYLRIDTSIEWSQRNSTLGIPSILLKFRFIEISYNLIFKEKNLHF